MIVENGIKQIRMGSKLNFVNYVVLSDGTVLQNMQCDLTAQIPSDEQLERFNKRNHKKGIVITNEEIERVKKLLSKEGAN